MVIKMLYLLSLSRLTKSSISYEKSKREQKREAFYFRNTRAFTNDLLSTFSNQVVENSHRSCTRHSVQVIQLRATSHLAISMRGQRATSKIQMNNYHHWNYGPSLTVKTSSVSLILTHQTHR